MAEDFRAAFGLGEDDKHISTIDEVVQEGGEGGTGSKWVIFYSKDTGNLLFQSVSLFLNQTIPQFWCRPSPPNTRKHVQRFGIVCPFQKVARRLHSRPSRPSATGVESVTWPPSRV